jgi:hypothetical protein
MGWIVESDNWGPGPNILAEDVLGHVAKVLEQSPVIVEHWFYRGASAPERRVFDDMADLHVYLTEAARPGDKLWLWRFDELCRDDNALAHGKVPDERGRVPKGGAY